MASIDMKLTYSIMYNNLMDKFSDDLKLRHNSVFDNMNALYIPLFQVMDIANEKKISCGIKDIYAKMPFYESLQNTIKSNDSGVEFDEMMDEMQSDVDLILTKGFPAFETKIINLIDEIEEEDKQHKELIAKINNCASEIRNLRRDKVLETLNNE